MQSVSELKQLLEWYQEAGVDEAIDTQAKNQFKALPEVAAITPSPSKPMNQTAPLTNGAFVPPSQAAAEAKAIAERVTSIAELKEAVENFEGCLLKRTATNTVFADGNPEADVMVIGEAPGEQEDKRGIPFCGRSGQLLDNVLASIGLTREKNLYISNTIFWRPPGNRTPSNEEVAICAPLVQKHIALLNPKLLILAGGVASSVLGNTLSVSKMRGKFHDYNNEYLQQPTKAAVIYHPSYLLRSPGQKAQAWKDMLMIQEFLES